MALAITYTPPAYSSAHDDLVYTVADAAAIADPTSFPNFKYIADVYIGGNMVARIRKIPDPVTGIGIFNIGPIARAFLSIAFNPVINSLVADTFGGGTSNLAVIIKFGEQYGYVDHLNLVEPESIIYFNNYNGRLVGITSSMLNVLDRVCSNRPFIGQTFLTSLYNLISYFPTTTATVPVIVTPYGKGGVVGSVITTSFTPANIYNLTILNMAPTALNAVQPGTISAATAFYTVQIGTLTYTFNIICEPMYQSYMLHFLNQYGGMDSRIFSKVSRKTYDIVKADYGKLPYTVDGGGLVTWKSSNGVYNENRSTYAVNYTEKLQLNSDLLTDGEYAWLADLILSPLIYIEDSGYLFPCVITDTTYEPKKAVNDDLTNLVINIEYGTQLTTQFR